ncbi:MULTISPECIES: hypothetical protein [unclassified Bradyrhizobium]|uniref:hypothetical protein n=1 Tax=unclassified Bradyrhizobium TaxID=2631580 RepID=UPI0028E415FA|nr:MULTISPECIES: hypothetical protein [unclassified Bradyrhizobium]
MARKAHHRDISPTLLAATQWIERCLINDGSLFLPGALWTLPNVEEVSKAFVDHPDHGDDDFLTKLKGQINPASPEARRLMAEMIWSLLLFPSNMKAATKRQQIREIWALGGSGLHESEPLLEEGVLRGVGSGGAGFNAYRPSELEYLLALVRDLKARPSADRIKILGDYDEFVLWIAQVPRKGSRQFRHMLRFFAFPDLVERISSNNDRRKVLIGFGVAPANEVKGWSDIQLDKALLTLRESLEEKHPDEIVDFYSSSLKPRWSKDQKIRTADGEVTVVVPVDNDDDEEVVTDEFLADTSTELRPSYQIQAKLAEIGARIGFKIWLPPSDRARIRSFMSSVDQLALLDELPLVNEGATLSTIELIDVIWLSGRTIVRAFEVEHTTTVYSGLLRMADLLALQPNLAIQFHIVAPSERREKFFREIRRPVFSLLNGRPLARSCTFISYESVNAIRSIEHLAHLNHTIIREYEEQADEN